MQLVFLTQTFLPFGVLLILLCIVAFFSFVYSKERKIFTKESDVLREYEKILLKAHTEAIAILKKANRRAENLVAKGSFIQKEELDAVKKKLREQTITALNLYKKELSVIEENLEKAATEELEIYTDSLHSSLTGAQERIDKELADELTKAKRELMEYKQAQKAQFDEAFKELTRKVAAEVLGKSISLADHEAIIEKAIEQAKHDAIFTV